MKKDMMSREFLNRIKEDGYQRGFPFVTISREAGAGGHTLAEAIRKQTLDYNYKDLFRGWLVFDEAICTAVIKDPALHVTMEELLAETYNGPIVDFFHELVGKQSSHYTVATRIFEFVKTICSFGKVIVVGRAASCVAEDLPGGIHVRLTASLDSRIQHVAQFLHIEPDAARRMIHKQDKDRARLVRDFFNRSIDDAGLYTMVWDTDKMPIERIAKEVIPMIEQNHEQRKVSAASSEP